MKDVSCFAPEEADAVLAAPADDPRRRHAASCPRCGALLDAYASFMRAESPEAGIDVDRLERKVRERMDAALGVGAAPSAGLPPARVLRERDTWLDRMLHPAMRPALAFGALAVVAAGVLLVTREASPPGIVLRGDARPFEVQGAEARDGALELRWPSVPGAEEYRIRVYSVDLRDLAERASGVDTVARLAAGDLAGLAPGDTLLVRIEALAGGDVVQATPLRAMRAP